MARVGVIVEFHCDISGIPEEDLMDAFETLDETAEKIAEDIFPGCWTHVSSDVDIDQWLITIAFQVSAKEYLQARDELAAKLEEQDLELVDEESEDDGLY